jgi:hypothetical protein
VVSKLSGNNRHTDMINIKLIFPNKIRTVGYRGRNMKPKKKTLGKTFNKTHRFCTVIPVTGYFV